MYVDAAVKICRYRFPVHMQQYHDICLYVHSNIRMYSHMYS